MGERVYVIYDCDCGGPVAVCASCTGLTERLRLFRKAYPTKKYSFRDFHVWTDSDLQILQQILDE